MTNLSDRVQKAKGLNFVSIPGAKTSTGGVESPNSNKHYQVSLYQKKEWELVEVADEKLQAVIISTCCQWINLKSGKLNPMCDCQGNSRHTVCYHSLGFLKFRLAQKGKEISFYENILTALNGLNFGGQLTKVISKQGQGYVWAVVRDKPKILSVQENINLMRGSEDDEGID